MNAMTLCAGHLFHFHQERIIRVGVNRMLPSVHFMALKTYSTRLGWHSQEAAVLVVMCVVAGGTAHAIPLHGHTRGQRVRLAQLAVVRVKAEEVSVHVRGCDMLALAQLYLKVNVLSGVCWKSSRHAAVMAG